MKYVFGIDVGGTNIKIGLFDENKILVSKTLLKTNTTLKGKYVVSELKTKIEQILSVNKITLEAVLGLGIGVPGPVKDNFIIRCPNLGWENKDLAKELQAEFKKELLVLVSNDASVAAYGEYNHLKSEKDIVFMTLGTGVGGAVIIDQKIVEGKHGSGGEIGHIQVRYDEPKQCSCGLYGCLETTASIRGIRWIAEELLLNYQKPTILTASKLTPKTIFAAALKNDELALEIVEEVATYIAKACAKIALVVDPALFIIGGGISQAGQILLDAIKRNYLKYSYFATREVEFALAKLGNDAGMYGASELVFKNKEKDESNK
ncbi:MAG: ROK family protein [Acholeplasmataceae bacterium]|jgi:glucokinase|nr:ROK family protein [Acholeplasmataceae bacterium]